MVRQDVWNRRRTDIFFYSPNCKDKIHNCGGSKDSSTHALHFLKLLFAIPRLYPSVPLWCIVVALPETVINPSCTSNPLLFEWLTFFYSVVSLLHQSCLKKYMFLETESSVLRRVLSLFGCLTVLLFDAPEYCRLHRVRLGQLTFFSVR